MAKKSAFEPIEFEAVDFAALNDANRYDFGAEVDKPVEKREKRRTTLCTVHTEEYYYRRAYSEVELLEAMKYQRLEAGCVYNFLTMGDVDTLSYFKIVLNQHERLDHVLMSTWCMFCEDILQLCEWYEEGRIGAIDMYLGKIFAYNYKVEYAMVKDFYAKHPEAGRVTVFDNHSKIWAGCNVSEGFYFGIQGSANVNTNPRTEQACIQVDKGLYEFYKNCFEPIVSFDKETRKQPRKTTENGKKETDND